MSSSDSRSASGAPHPSSGPIRPVGYRDPRIPTIAVYLTTAIQIVVTGATAWFCCSMFVREASDPSFEPEAAELTALFGFNLVPPDYDDLKYRIEPFHLARQWAELRFAWLFSVLLAANIVGGLIEHGCFLAWQLRMRTNAAALGATGFLHSPVASVAWWFVPIADLWKPERVVREIWQASEPYMPPYDGRARRDAPSARLIVWWWRAVVAAKVLYRLIPVMFVVMIALIGRPHLPGIEYLVILRPIAIESIGLAVATIAGILQLALVRRLVRRQALLYERRT